MRKRQLQKLLATLTLPPIPDERPDAEYYDVHALGPDGQLTHVMSYEVSPDGDVKTIASPDDRPED